MAADKPRLIEQLSLVRVCIFSSVFFEQLKTITMYTEADFGILNLKLVYLHICKENGANYFFRLLPHRMTAIHCLIIAHFMTMLAASMRGRFLLAFLAGFSSNWAS